MKVEHENLIRTLKDQPTLVSSILCRLGWHRWTKWINLPVTLRYDGTKVRYQERYCVHCNRLQVKRADEL